MRVAATAGVHARPEDLARLRALAEGAARDADVLVMGGDLTDLGHPEQAEVLVEALDGCPVPVVAVLGNHDHEGGDAAGVSRLLTQEGGVHLLERSSFVIDGVGFVGVKGFCGGFGPHEASSFGEDLFKAWVSEGIRDAEALEKGLRGLGAGPRVAVLHYAPVRDTVEREPAEIHAFLGTSRLAIALDRGGATVAFHGHAHAGPFSGETPGGVPVPNVSLPVLESAGFEKPYNLFEV